MADTASLPLEVVSQSSCDNRTHSASADIPSLAAVNLVADILPLVSVAG